MYEMFLAAAGCLIPIVLTAKGWDLDLVWGAANCGFGALISLGSPHWRGAVNLTLGVVLVWSWWNRRGPRQKVKRWLGAKSTALRNALTRTLRERTVSVPA